MPGGSDPEVKPLVDGAHPDPEPVPPSVIPSPVVRTLPPEVRAALDGRSEAPHSVRFATTAGIFTVRLDPTGNPVAARKFARLAEAGFYDGLSFHRLEKGYVLQGGDPQGGPGAPEHSFRADDSFRGQLAQNSVALVAREGSRLVAPQFFVWMSNDVRPPQPYPVVGSLSQSEDFLGAIDRWSVVGAYPSPPILIERASVE